MWHAAPHELKVPSTCVHTGLVLATLASKSLPPWQYAPLQVAEPASKVGELSIAVATALQAKSTTPFLCLSDAGTLWQSSHCTSRCHALVAKCCWCAPTAGCVVSVSPLVPTGGAGLPLSTVPWQL